MARKTPLKFKLEKDYEEFDVHIFDEEDGWYFDASFLNGAQALRYAKREVKRLNEFFPDRDNTQFVRIVTTSHKYRIHPLT